MIETPLTEDALRVAMGRLEDFIAVHHGKEEIKPAFAILRESLGITDELMEEFTNWVDEVVFLDEPSPEASALFGLMMGLIAADHG